MNLKLLKRDRLHVLAAVVSAATVFGAADAHAHFKLTKPTSWIVEDALGDPQKNGPCGPASGAAMTPSDEVTTFQAGETIMVEWTETIAHPGHFRIALARNREDLMDPDITVDGQCNYTDFEDQTGVYPVLLDNLFPRTGFPLADTFEQAVTLPDEPCENCTLQVIQFMTSHSPSCIYYHCANINVVAAGGEGDAGIVAGTGGMMATGGGGGMMMGTGGMMMGTGGTAATGGTGGAAGTAAPAGAGGAGATAGAAGMTAGAAGTGMVVGTGGSAPVTPSSDTSESGCTVGSVGARGNAPAGLLGLLGLAWLLTRRRNITRA